MFKRRLNKRRMRQLTEKGMEIEDSVMTATQEEKAMIEIPYRRKGIHLIWYVIVLVICGLLIRVFYLDSIKGDYYKEVARGNRIRSVVIKAPRGNILDKYGHILARNVPSVDIIVVPSDLPKSYEDKKIIVNILADILGMDNGNLEALILTQNEKSLDPVLVKENISQEQALILAEKMLYLPGIYLEKTAIRNYENSVMFSHVIGYDGKITREEMDQNDGYLMTDYIGKAGIEKTYEKELRGAAGAHQVEIDSKGTIKKNLGIIPPQPGSDLVLHIDEELQKKLYDAIVQVLEKTETKTASAVAIDPRNGGVLAMVSIPSYDNNLFARGIGNDEYKSLISDKSLPLLNRATAGEYPPGSTVKPALASGALSEGVITPTTIIDGLGGALHIGNFRFGDWKVHGPSDVRRAIAESNDIFFYTIGGGYGNISGLGMTKMKKYYNLFGFGQLTGIDLSGEESGFIPDEEWKKEKIGEKWYVGNSYHAAIGQGYVSATPLQLANYTASIANGGTLYVPHVVNRIKNTSGTDKFVSPEIIRKDFVSREVMNVVREGMRQTITEGTAQSLKDLPVAVAGKTGTAQFGSEDKTHAWFISFAPYESPEIAMVVLAEGAGEGHSSSVPVTKEIYEWYFNRQ